MPEPCEPSNPRPPDDTSLFQEQRGWLSKRIVLVICAITPKCPEVVRLLSLGMDQPLPLSTRIKLRVHYLMCSFCGRYAKQLEDIRKFTSAFPEHVDEASSAKLSGDAKSRLKEKLRQPPA